MPAVNRVEIDLLRGIDRVRDILVENTERFAAGLPANNVLLWGARGTGKSALVKAAHAAINEAAARRAGAHRDPPRGHPEPAAPVVAGARQQAALPVVLRRPVVRKAGHQLQIAEGGARGRDRGPPGQCRALRHLEPAPPDAARHDRERALDRDQPGRGGRGERVAVGPLRAVARLSQRRPGRPITTIVCGYAKHYRLDLPEDQLRAEANEWAITRGSRSGRVAWQFIQDLAGRLGKKLG